MPVLDSTERMFMHFWLKLRLSVQLVAQGVPILQGGEELGGPIGYLRSQIHLLMSIARVRPDFDPGWALPLGWRG